MKSSRLFILCFAVFVLASSAFAQTYNASAGFSANNNPNGCWTWGWSADLSGALHTYTYQFLTNSSYNWGDASIEQLGAPVVAYNYHDVAVSGIPAHGMYIHPGPGNEFSHCVWTAPAAGSYQIQASFTAISFGGPHAYILKNGSVLGDSLLRQGAPWSFSADAVTLAAGDTVEAVSGVGVNNSFTYDGALFDLSITRAVAPAPSGSILAGTFHGLVTGTSGAAGVLSLNALTSGRFSAELTLKGIHRYLKGSFKTGGTFTVTYALSGGKRLTVSLLFDANGHLVGTLSLDGETFAYTGDEPSPSAELAGYYPFIITASQSQTPGTENPAGIGFGSMHVFPNGSVSLVGELGDKTGFATSSFVTSGSLIAVYATPYPSETGQLAGTLVLRDVPGISDCDGTLSWIKPASPSSTRYPLGFQLSTEFQASRFAPQISGLSGDNLLFSAGDANVPFFASVRVTLHTSGPFGSTFSGSAPGLDLNLEPAIDFFHGSFSANGTDAIHPFIGILLPKSRTGAGLFMTGSTSQAVELTY